MRGQRRALGWAVGVLIVLGGFTLALWQVADGLGRRAVARQTEAITRQVAERIRGCVVTRVEMIRALRHEWALGGLRDDRAFTARADALLATFPGFLAINRIDERGEITFVHPADPNKLALNRNIAESPRAMAELRLALAEGVPRLSPPVQLFQQGTGVTAYVPTSTPGEPPVVLNGAFRTETLIPACLGEDAVPGYALAIQDADTPVFTRATARPVEGFAVEAPVVLVNRRWGVRMTPDEARVATMLRPGRLILVAGLPLALGVALLLFAVIAVRERARADARRMATALQQAQRMEALGRLSGGVAHDFNNLLTAILTSTHLLGEAVTAPDQRELVGTIEDAARRGAALTRELLVFGRGEAGATGPLDLAATVAGLRGLLTRLIRADITVDVRTPDAPVRLDGSAVQLEQIVVNLVMNAVAAMPQGGRLTLEVARRGDRAVLVVADTGAGIAPEIADRIFEPFFTTKEAGEGTGLGLATVYSHVQRMHGTITVESTPGAGATFTASFPAIDGIQ